MRYLVFCCRIQYGNQLLPAELCQLFQQPRQAGRCQFQPGQVGLVLADMVVNRADFGPLFVVEQRQAKRAGDMVSLILARRAYVYVAAVSQFQAGSVENAAFTFFRWCFYKYLLYLFSGVSSIINCLVSVAIYLLKLLQAQQYIPRLGAFGAAYYSFFRQLIHYAGRSRVAYGEPPL